ncbi:MAG: MATE family efflux transporter [Rhodospirillales bacterium]|nr:MATE family efflux transporter [Rhodospirillales bacterium]
MTRFGTLMARVPALPVSLAPWRSEARATLVLAWPLSLAFLAETAIAMVDVIIIGRLGADALAAAALGTTSFFVAFILSLGVTLATAPLAAQAMGARKPRRVRRVIRQGLWITILLGFPSAAALLAAEHVLILLDQPAEASRSAQVYLDYLAWALPPAIGFMVLRNFAAVLNRPRLGLWVLLAAIPLNAVLDYGLVLGRLGMPRMEIAGAGLASLIAHAFMFLAMLWIALRVRPLSRYTILGRFWRPDWSVFLQIFRVGLPIAGILTLEFGLIVVSLVMIGWIGPNALAAHQIALMLASVTFKVPLGISQAATVRVGNAAGRGDVAGIARAGWTAMIMGVVFMAAMTLIMWTWPDALASIFLDRADAGNAAVMTLAASLILVAAVFQIGDGAQTIGAGVLRGLSDTKIPMTFAAFGFWVLGLSAGYLLAFRFDLGAVGVWIGITVGLSTVALFHVARFRHLTRIGYLPRVATD